MKHYYILVFLLFTLFVKVDSFSQNKPYFNPDVWLFNQQKINDSVKEFNVLNFNYRLGLSKTKAWTSANNINDANHLFVVYRSNQDENLIALLGHRKSLFIDGKKVKLRDSINTEGYNESYGELLDIRFSGIEQGKIWLNSNFKESNLFEVILMQGNLPIQKVNEIRTYLSIKYGVDLIDSEQYRYKGSEWWKGINKRFTYNIFGVARLDGFGLNNHISTHSKDKDLIVTRGLSTDKSFDEGDYILFGSNKQPLTFDRRTKMSKKQWLVKTNRVNTVVDLAVPTTVLNQNTNFLYEYELIVTGENKVQTYYGKLKDSLLVFNDIPFTVNENRIISLKEHKSNLKFQIENNCNTFRLGIVTPNIPRDFSMKITDDKGKLVYNTLDPDDVYEIRDTNSSFFDIYLSYDNKIVSKRVKTELFNLKPQGLNKQYTLFNGPQKIHLKNDKNLIIRWFENGQLIGNGNEVIIEKEGNYHVEISNLSGCTVKESFIVSNDFNDQGWRVYPNPALATEEVFVRFQLLDESEVELALYANDGKLVKSFSVGKIQNETIGLGTLNLSSGVYIIVAYIDTIPEIKKIIIK